MERVLLVDDEKKIREFVGFFLKKEGIEVLEASNGLEAVNMLRENEVDLVLMDLMMPLMSGFDACKEIRLFSSVPIIMLTAVEGDAEHIEGYALVIDDYMIKPFKMPILMAKIKRILSKNQSNTLVVRDLRMEISSREVYLGEERIQLAPKEYELLLYMVKNKNIALSRNQLLEEIWGYDYDGGTRVIDNHIKKLRNKLKPFDTYIVTVSGHGYKIEV